MTCFSAARFPGSLSYTNQFWRKEQSKLKVVNVNGAAFANLLEENKVSA